MMCNRATKTTPSVTIVPLRVPSEAFREIGFYSRSCALSGAVEALEPLTSVPFVAWTFPSPGITDVA